MVAAVEPGSVGGEDRKIEAGDVFDEIFGKCLRKGKERNKTGWSTMRP